ncbi:HNH endonuclease [Vibrio cyclitrophicus 1F53]|uniref:HNH endonuclease n=1 Tax=Vibrio cyclitrophicus TaxID=47951 RepID=UPI0038A4CBA9
MKKLEHPHLSHSDVLEKIKEGISRKNDIDRFSEAKEELLELGLQYSDLAVNGQLFSIRSINGQPNSTVVVNPLTKKKLIRLYEYYLLNQDKPGREIYEELLASAEEKCPMCGDIGRPRNLDHFLPKAHFPQYSVLPFNLVPCCRDCNMDGKGQGFATIEENQLIHPYTDKNIFSSVQWVFAKYIQEEPGAIEYWVDPPATWSDPNQLRAHKHFEELDLANRYQIEAAKHLSEVIDQAKASVLNLRTIIRDIEPTVVRSSIQKTIFEPIIEGSLFDNHWKKVMYRALNDSEEFFEILET